MGARRSKSNLVAVLATIAVVAVAGVFFFFDPAQGGFYPACMFHNLTGLNCPGCGSLRALHHLTHGEILAAFRSNPLLITLLPLIAFVGVRWLTRGRDTFVNDPILFRPAAAWTLLVVTIAFAVLRNLPWPAFAWMSP